MLASVTRLRVRSVIYLPAFIWQTFLSQGQVVRADGFRGGRLLIDPGRAFWTLTVWESERGDKGVSRLRLARQGYAAPCEMVRGSLLRPLGFRGRCSPGVARGLEQLVRDARLSRVEHPSPNYEARRRPETPGKFP